MPNKDFVVTASCKRCRGHVFSGCTITIYLTNTDLVHARRMGERTECCPQTGREVNWKTDVVEVQPQVDKENS